jgi:hypothetical protein
MRMFALTIGCILFIPLCGYGQSNDPIERESLKGLTGVWVFVNVTEESPSLERDGLTKSQIQTDVEIRLRKAGVKVLTLEELKQLRRRPALVIHVLASKNEALSKVLGENIYAFTIQVDVKHTARLLDSTNNEILLVTTWSDTAVGMTTKRNIRTIREGVGDYVDKFINDYLAANPR